MTRLRASEAIALAIAGIMGTGCFGYYRPITPDLAGRRVQLSLTDSGAVVLAPRLGNEIESVDGTLTADSAGEYTVAVVSTKRRDGQENDWRGEPVRIPHTLVSTVSERRFSRARTMLFATATSIALAATKHAFGGGGGANAPGGTPTGPGTGK
jgi:hypothetical protein